MPDPAPRRFPPFEWRIGSDIRLFWGIQASVAGHPDVNLRFGVVRRSEARCLAEDVAVLLAAACTKVSDVRAADRHGLDRADLVAKGRRIGDFDAMITAHALALGAILVTDNVRRFSQVKGLRIENWMR